jgi:hypothetical protein
MPVTKLFTLACCLLATACLVQADPARWHIAVKREKWTGLKGEVQWGGEHISLPDLLWEIKSAAEPDGNDVIPEPIVPFRNNLRAVDRPPAKIEIAEPVVLRVRGKTIEFKKVGQQSTTISSIYDGYYLASEIEDYGLQLTLTKTPGKHTEWRVVDAEQSLSKSRGEYQYNLELNVKFRLESVSRPGWFLRIDDDRRLFLSDSEKKRYIEMEVEKRYDDQSDGK